MFVHVFYRDVFVKTVEVRDSVSSVAIGRMDECEVSLEFDSLISRKHAVAEREKDGVLMTDNGSKNGIILDGEKVEKAKVPFEKRVHVGESSLIFSETPYQEVKKTIVLDSGVMEKMKKEIEEYKPDEALSFLYRTAMKAGQHQSEDSLLDELFEELSRTYRAERIILFEKDRKGKGVVVKKLQDSKFLDERKAYSRTVVNEVLETHKAVFIQNVISEVPDRSRSMRSLGISSVIAVPLMAGKEMVGILQLEIFQSQKNFTEKDFYTVCILCQMISGFFKGIKALDQVKRENTLYKEQMARSLEIIGEDKKIAKVKELIAKVARTDTTVLITGESGTGKELVARAVHYESSRKGRPFVIINCAAIPENLIESELFGHEKGAFTGAEKTRTGKLEAADGGSVFLDEIGDMGIQLQTRLLRFLESGEIQPVGSNETRYSDVRIIAATNKKLKEAVEKGTFRGDLYYRLSVFHIECPPLRERGRDIIGLARHFLQNFSASMGKDLRDISLEAERVLLRYPWPGNIRELKNIIERACVIGEGNALVPDFLPEDVRQENPALYATAAGARGGHDLEQVEKECILSVLKGQNNNKAKAAHILGITRKTLYSKLEKYGIGSKKE